MPAQKILAGRLSRDEMHARMFKATVYEIFRLVDTPIIVVTFGSLELWLSRYSRGGWFLRSWL